MKKKRYLMIVCLLSSPSFFINVEASDGGSSSVGMNFTKIREHPLLKMPHRKQMRQLLIPRNQLVLRKEINEVVVRHRPPQLARSSLVQGARVRQILAFLA